MQESVYAPIAEADYNLSPGRYVDVSEKVEVADIQAILDELAALRVEERGLEVELAAVFSELGFLWDATVEAV